jgi:hypothetical protein
MPQNIDIGDLIMLLSPYTNDKLRNTNAGPPTGQMDVYSPRGHTIQDIELEVDAHYPGEWTFKGQPHRLGLAARIRYRYPVTDGANPPHTLYWVEDYLLVGFENGGI